ncbi:amidohydrolase family protein [Colwellia sp. MSW7]|jgi:L-fuconolactonase|uniref:Amidohydrolase family protein n=1 Tax=Colwellia maritima TaxID=2912588 RepID=A0ABS9X1D7_9GAMM|nr:amidohydrolase family protein [Colwellia maritima]MCI2283990.1 amidohydrolase family protein [Colwellia maritima]
MKRIDSHQHFWQLSRGDYTWLTKDLGVLFRDYMPTDLKRELSHANVSDTILVQAAETLAETDFMFRQAYTQSFVSGVVGWVDMEGPEVLEQLTWFMENPYFKGIRPMIQEIDDVNWMLKSELTPVFAFLEDNELSFDALVLPMHLENLQKLLIRHPKLHVVIDHGGKPQIAEALGFDIANSINRQWAEDIAQLAKNKNVFCKLSGLVTEAGDKASYADIEPYMTHLLNCFGANKLMWGSDWPVVNLTSDYSSWFDIAAKFIAKQPKQDQENIWSGAAKNFYRL